MDQAKTPSLGQRLQQAGLTKSYAYMIASGKRTPSLTVACDIFRQTGLKLGPLADLSDAQARTLTRPAKAA